MELGLWHLRTWLGEEFRSAAMALEGGLGDQLRTGSKAFEVMAWRGLSRWVGIWRFALLRHNRDEWKDGTA